MFRAIFATVTAQPNALVEASVKVFRWQMCGEIDDENRTLVDWPRNEANASANTSDNHA
jgi:hypothetical protein